MGDVVRYSRHNLFGLNERLKELIIKSIFFIYKGIENEANVDWEIIISNVPPCASEVSAFLAATAMLKKFYNVKSWNGTTAEEVLLIFTVCILRRLQAHTVENCVSLWRV